MCNYTQLCIEPANMQVCGNTYYLKALLRLKMLVASIGDIASTR